MDYQDFLKLSKKELMHIIVKATQQAQAERYSQRVKEIECRSQNMNVKTAVIQRLTTNSNQNVRNAKV